LGSTIGAVEEVDITSLKLTTLLMKGGMMSPLIWARGLLLIDKDLVTSLLVNLLKRPKVVMMTLVGMLRENPP
jgi:hypothetical protein